MLNSQTIDIVARIHEMSTAIAILILKFSHGVVNSDEHDRLDRWVESTEENQELFERFIEAIPSERLPLYTIS